MSGYNTWKLTPTPLNRRHCTHSGLEEKHRPPQIDVVLDQQYSSALSSTPQLTAEERQTDRQTGPSGRPVPVPLRSRSSSETLSGPQLRPRIQWQSDASPDVGRTMLTLHDFDSGLLASSHMWQAPGLFPTVRSCKSRAGFHHCWLRPLVTRVDWQGRQHGSTVN